MTAISPLSNIIKKGLFGDYENKNENDLVKIKELNDLLIVQIVQYQSSKLEIENLKVDNINFSREALTTACNDNTRILWFAPRNWMLVSKKKELINNVKKTFNDSDFAVTDLSQSRTIIEICGKNSKEVLKKGCPFNFNILKKNMCLNSIFNGVTITIDLIEENPDRIRLFALRSFGESLYHSITDASLEFGYKID